MQQVSAIEVWGCTKLMELVPGSTRKHWLTSWVPMLVASKALKKCGKSWLGRRTEIERVIGEGLAK